MIFNFIFWTFQNNLKMNLDANYTSGWICSGRNKFHFNTNHCLCCTDLYTLSFGFIVFLTFYLSFHINFTYIRLLISKF